MQDRRRLAVWICKLLAVSLPLVACSSGSFDRSVSSSETIYQNDLSEQELAQARETIGGQFARGLADYRINSGDVLEILFLFGSGIEVDEYQLHVGDVIHIEFYYHDEISRRLTIRPDGRVTLPLHGDIDAVGLTPRELGDELVRVFSSTFNDPRVTVTVEEFTSSTGELAEALDDLVISNGNGRTFQVAPDGKLYPPFIEPVAAAGKTVAQLQSAVREGYQQRFSSLEIALQLSELAGNRVFVFGEVRSPGAYQLQGPQTVLQMVAMAGGWLPTAAEDKVRVVYWDQNLEARVRQVDVEAVAKNGFVSQEMILPANSTIYVPPSSITLANRFIDQYVRQLFLFNGTNLSVTYEQNVPD
jgi:polysaccharide biosynthesis/export protein PslD